MTIREAYEALAAAIKATDREQAIDQLRQCVNADPSVLSVLPVLKEASERSAIPGLAIPDKAIPA